MASYRRGGRALLVVGDIGDNLWIRPYATLYEVEEPPVGTPDRPVTGAIRPVRQVEFTFEGGPHDCEALAVDPSTGRFYLVSKEGLRCTVFELAVPEGPPPADGSAPSGAGGASAGSRPLEARAVATLTISPVVAMDISPDGRRAVVLTYGDALEFIRPPGRTWPQAFAAPPRIVRMPRRRQGESICYGPDGRTLYLTSEHTPTPLWEVPVLEKGAGVPAEPATPRPSSEPATKDGGAAAVLPEPVRVPPR